MPPAQRGQLMSETIELFEKVNLYQETQRAEVDMATVRLSLSWLLQTC